ncbi:MAG: trans-2-enoyl-CoA reductase family protein [bacterium]|nr:trans-2-enoyl-CoA reductase family protein [bacterium]
MARKVVTPRVRRLICANAHPEGCAVNVRRLVDKVQQAGPKTGLGNVLVLGSSTGYGLASLATAIWGWGSSALSVCFERPAQETRTASAGWYNIAEVHRMAREQGRHVETLNGDAFAHEMRTQVVEILRERFGLVDLVIYSLASPRRKDPDSDTVWNSVIKPIGTPHGGKHIELRSETVTGHGLEPATEEEVEATVKVMGGEDWELWIRLLAAEGLLADGARALAYSYIGPRVTHPIYRTGTIGRAKEHLEATANRLDSLLEDLVGGHCWISVNKAAVTQASAVIPAVPLYKSLLYRVMKEAGTHELPSDQMIRMFEDHVGPGRTPTLDAHRRIRLDDREMSPETQRRVQELWEIVDTENLNEISDWSGFKREFLQLFGFQVDGVDYDEPVETDVSWE